MLFKKKKQTVSATKTGKIIASIDIGTSKIVCLIAEVDPQNGIHVIGIGHQASKGVRGGIIVDSNLTERAIAKAVHSAEKMARHRLQNIPLSKIIVNVSAKDSKVFPSSSEILTKGTEIQENHIQKLLHQCQSHDVPDSMEIIHKIPMGFNVDGISNVENPIGMIAEKVEANVLEIAVQSLPVRNIAHVIENNHLDIEFFCILPYASGLSCLVDDEMEMGTVLIDIGAGTTNIGIFSEGHLVHTSTIPIGGNHITSDIAQGLTTPVAHAERLKTLFGSAIASPLDDGDLIDTPQVGENDIANVKQVPRSLLLGIIQPRLEEMFEMIRAQIQDSGVADLAGRRAVLTGGTSQLPGIRELASHALDKQVRLGKPDENIKSSAGDITSPIFSTALGLIHYGLDHVDEAPAITSPYTTWSILHQVGQWLRENW